MNHLLFVLTLIASLSFSFCAVIPSIDPVVNKYNFNMQLYKTLFYFILELFVKIWLH